MTNHGRCGRGWTVVLRRQPVHIVEGQPVGGYTDAYELVCCQCGDDPDADYRDVSPWLRQIRGPYRFAAGIEAYSAHMRRYHMVRAMAGPSTSLIHGDDFPHPGLGELC